MKLSSEEQKLILKHRKSQLAKLPIKLGYAREDLYHLDDYRKLNWYASKSEREQIIADFSSRSMSLSVHAGSKFECYIEDGHESWYDSESGLFSAMDADWAKQYLTDISPVKHKTKSPVTRKTKRP